LDTALVPGIIVLDGPSRVFPHQEEHYCCFALTHAIDEEWRAMEWKEQCDTIFTAYHEAAMLEPWVFLGLLGQRNGFFLDQRSEWLKPLVRAAVRFWPVLAAEGARYSKGLEAQELWSLPTKLSFALARLGVPLELLNAPLPAGGLDALVRETLPDLETV
jgi:hypothetical protein